MSSSTKTNSKNYIIIGVSKSGKTTFINHVFGTNFEAGLNDGKSVTVDVNAIHKPENHIFGDAVVYDTPGMNDATRSDAEIANEIVYGLLKNCKNGNTKIDGVVFIYKIGEILNLDQYKKLMENLSSSFTLENMCLVFTQANSFSQKVGIKKKQEARDMCSNRGIPNFVFWDSEEPIEQDENGDHQNVALKNKLQCIKSFSLDKLADFDKTVQAKANELREKNKVPMTRTKYYEETRQRAVTKYNSAFHKWTHNEDLNFWCDGNYYNRDITIDFKSQVNPYFDSFGSYRYGNSRQEYTPDYMDKPHRDGVYHGNCFTFVRRIQTKNKSVNELVNFWCEVNYETKTPYDGLENYQQKVPYSEAYFEYQDVSKFMDEARMLTLESFVSKYKPAKL